MISDDDLYRLAIFLGSMAMVLIVLYNFFEVNSQEDNALAKNSGKANPARQASAGAKQS
ncbi:Oligosaccaryltransferase-domain-containing protein [Camillea tinctor]|nr:Oligosaccaryltransferase-domain-containing protein [Camillea tinctor]